MKNSIYGVHPIIEALKAGKTIEKVLIKQNSKSSNITELIVLLKKNNIPFQYVPIEKLNKITKSNHQGVIAFMSIVEYSDLEDVITNTFEKGKSPIILMIDNITDVRNFGSIARTCECAGVDAIVIPKRNSVSVTPDAIKTSAGALNRIPVCKVDNLTDSVILLQQMGVHVAVASEKTSKTIYETNLNKPIAIVVGAEDKGVSTQILKKADELVKIPIYGNVQSLNVSVAAAVFIYEVVRQRL